MGGSSYSRDVSSYSSVRRSRVFDREEYIRVDQQERRECHEDLNIKNRVRGCFDSREHPDATPIVVAMDVTGSRGEDAKVIYGKLPMFIGQLEMKNYVKNPMISFAAIGDATSGDRAPIQVGEFKSDESLDIILSKIWLEGGGGGTGQESYELMAYYYARHSELSINKKGKKGYFFFIGDEGFYSDVAKDQVKVWIGDEIPSSIPSEKIFRELQEKYYVFFIYPQKTWEQRKGDIDIEIKKRVEQAGGMYQGVDIRVSLLWNNRNDLDIHVVPPVGREIYFNHKREGDGWLDVDMNVDGETLKPVENIRWPKGKAPKGHYKIYVQNYNTHGGYSCETDFRVEVEINGKILHFDGKTPERKTGYESNVAIYEFDYDPSDIQLVESDVYSGYKDEVIKRQWVSVIPDENILIIEDPNAIVDVLMGAIVVTEGNISLDSYLVDMTERGQTQLRLTQTKLALENLGESKALCEVDMNQLPDGRFKKIRKSKIQRL